MKEQETNLTETATTLQTSAPEKEAILGFEEARPEDTVVPRAKVINALSPERIDKEAEEGDVVNSLTKENLTGKAFIPVKQFYTNIRWNPDRNDDVRILCRSFDGRVGDGEEGVLTCAACRRNQFDNSKTGKDAQPSCTAYLNFLGFMEGEPMPVVLSFAKTNYNEGKKLLSIAKSLRTSAWNYKYILESRKISKDKNVWYILTTRIGGETSPEDRIMGNAMYGAYETLIRTVDYEESGAPRDADIDIDNDDSVEI